MIIFGIDCGLTGAISALRDDGAFQDVRDLPVITNAQAKWIDGMQLIGLLREMRNGCEARVVIERTQTTPKITSATANSMGLTLGSVLAAVQIAGLSLELVTPQTWKRALGLLAPGTSNREKKIASLHRARQLFPSAPLERVADNNRAEALLIAHWACRYQHPTRQVA